MRPLSIYVGNTDEERFLTPLGEKQAAMTGKRLSDLMEKFKSMYKDENGNQLPVKFRVIKSTMQRATQTADIILKELATGVDEVKSCDLIREGAPIEPEPPTKAWNPSPHVSLLTYCVVNRPTYMLFACASISLGVLHRRFADRGWLPALHTPCRT